MQSEILDDQHDAGMSDHLLHAGSVTISHTCVCTHSHNCCVYSHTETSPLVSAVEAVQQWQFSWIWRLNNCFILAALDTVFIMLKHRHRLFAELPAHLKSITDDARWPLQVWHKLAECLNQRVAATLPITDSSSMDSLREMLCSQ